MEGIYYLDPPAAFPGMHAAHDLARDNAAVLREQLQDAYRKAAAPAHDRYLAALAAIAQQYDQARQAARQAMTADLAGADADCARIGAAIDQAQTQAADATITRGTIGLVPDQDGWTEAMTQLADLRAQIAQLAAR